LEEKMEQRNRLRKKLKMKLKKDDITVVDAKESKRAVMATSAGNAMEWFDFGIYSYLAATIGQVFFPEASGVMQLVYSFATFAIAFLVRPVGGIFFGILGDRFGRKNILSATLIIMAVSTLSIGLIPGYASIGSTATILLLLARLAQGFSTGGEYASAMTYIAESTPDKKRGFMSSGLEVGTLVGYIAGAGLVTALTYLLGEETMLAWGWRIPFFVAAPIGLIGFYLRNKLDEAPVYEAMESDKPEEENDEHASVKEILRLHWRPILIGLFVVFSYNVINYTVLSYMPSHLTAVLGYGEAEGLLLIVVVMLIMIPIVLLMGYASDRIGAKKIVQGGLVGLILLSVPAFLLIGSGNAILVFAGLMLLAVFSSTFQGTMPSVLPSLFFTNVRNGALAITYNISTSLFGGTTPLVVSWLISQTNNRMVPAYYLIFASVVGILVVTWFVKETSGKALRGSLPVVEEHQEIKEILENPEEALWWQEEARQIHEKKEELTEQP
jgi:MFS transporter, MHS family, proline/betaine transporter